MSCAHCAGIGTSDTAGIETPEKRNTLLTMILSTMSPKQIADHIWRDKDHYSAKILSYKNKAWKIARQMLRCEFSYLIPLHSNVSGQDYYVSIAKEKQGMGIRTTLAAIVRNEHSTQYYEHSEGGNIHIFTNHYIKRFCERMHIDMDVKEALKRVLPTTSIVIYRGNKECVLASRYGIDLCAKDDYVVTHCTFVSCDMLKDSQRRSFERVYDILNDYEFWSGLTPENINLYRNTMIAYELEAREIYKEFFDKKQEPTP